MSRLKLATFNIDKDNGKFPERIHLLSDVIYKNKFDILCLQEDFDSQKFSSGKFLNVELNYNYISTKTRLKDRNGVKSSSNLTILSKYPIELIDEIFFNKAKKEERACQIIKIDFDGYKIVLANTHLCHLNGKTRKEQIKTILKTIDSYNFDMAFICGDLNALPSYPEIQLIEKHSYKTINKEFTHEDKVILDYIFFKTDLNTRIESKILLKGFSDHNCLVNSISILKK